ncbi:hypothetical protein V8D89_013905 [Ganoderma adspersum]
MDNLRCNRLTCRRALSDKAVVVSSHIFCVDCANELFNASRLCPACETSLTEPLCSTMTFPKSVLSGLNPTIILEICSRALSFWQYQLHQEYSFQQALYKSVSEKNAQLEKRLENVIREGEYEHEHLERDLEMERRKSASLQDTLKEHEKEYQKLKTQYDKLKRKALLGGTTGSKDGLMPLNNQPFNISDRQEDAARLKQGAAFAGGIGGPAGVDVGAVVGNMEATGIQRTPIVNRTMAGGPIGMQTTATAAWRQPQPATHVRGRQAAQRQPFSTMEGSYRTSVSTTRSDKSDSTAEVENLLAQTGRYGHGPGRNPNAQWAMNIPQVQSAHSTPARVSTAQAATRGFAQSSSKRIGPKFKPAGVPMG